MFVHLLLLTASWAPTIKKQWRIKQRRNIDLLIMVSPQMTSTLCFLLFYWCRHLWSRAGEIFVDDKLFLGRWYIILYFRISFYLSGNHDKHCIIFYILHHLFVLSGRSNWGQWEVTNFSNELIISEFYEACYLVFQNYRFFW